ncbi:MAG: ABC transporter substrate-binding protein [Solirubrobacterales bacterium]
MSQDGGHQQKGSTRRKMLQGMGGAGLAGLAVGGLGGVLLSGGGDGEGSSSGSSGGGPITVGSALPLTGAYASDGLEMKRGIELAVSELNAKGGVLGNELKTEFLDVEDFAPDKTVATFRRLVSNSSVATIITGYILSVGPEIDVAAEAEMPYYGTNTSSAAVEQLSKDPEKYATCFPNLDSTDVWYARMFPNFVEELEETGGFKPRSRTIAIIAANNAYSESIAEVLRDEMAKINWKTSLFETVVAPVNDWGPTLNKIRQDPPDIIFNTDLAPGDLAAFAKQFVQNPTPSLIYGQYGPSAPEFLELAGDAANGWLWATLVGRLPDENGAAFVKRFEEKFNSAPGLAISAITYDLTYLWAQAASLAGDPFDGAKVGYWTKRSRYRGVCGVYWPYSSGDYVRSYPAEIDDPSAGQPALYFQVQGGEHKIIAFEPFTETKFEVPPWMA